MPFFSPYLHGDQDIGCQKDGQSNGVGLDEEQAQKLYHHAKENRIATDPEETVDNQFGFDVRIDAHPPGLSHLELGDHHPANADGQ